MTFLSVWVNTADSRRGGETCRKDRGTSEGLGNSTGGNFLSRQESVAPNSVGWIPPHLSFENEFLLFWLIWLPQGPTRWASDQLAVHLTHLYMMAFPLLLQLPNTCTPLPLLLWIPAFVPPSPPAVLLLASTANAALSCPRRAQCCQAPPAPATHGTTAYVSKKTAVGSEERSGRLSLLWVKTVGDAL